ncbi:MAG: ASPIC/UnbV domain-containing protein [Verrucomicrobiaceae bacterium]
MRDDPQKGKAFKKSKTFEAATGKAVAELESDFWGRDSLSGKERNRLFLSKSGEQFSDVSLLSGADHLGDGRSVVLFDYNRDGRTDMASINTNAPKLVLFRNEVATANSFAAFRFEGGNVRDAAEAGRSNRDGYGTRITLTVGGRKIVEEHRAGEGFSAQNSRTLLVGLGEVKTIDSVLVQWPSGVTQTFENLPVNQLITFSERSDDFSTVPYRR